MHTILAPAKLNLTLEVLSKRNDGYHEIRSVIQTIGLYDRLCFEPCDKIKVRCDDPNWILRESLIPLAVNLLQEKSGCSKGVTISLSKKIPLLSGLAGDSSGAAAALIGLNRFWGLGYSLGELSKLAEKLGSDVSFFLTGGTALVQGRGESVSPLPSLPSMWVVLLMPVVQRTIGKTGKLYASLKQSYFTEGQKTEKFVALLARGGKVQPSDLFNVFENVAYDVFPELGKFRDEFLKAGTDSVHLAGSGPALFTITADETNANAIYNKLKEYNFDVYLVKTLGAVDCMNLEMGD